jgi:heat shock protein HslJ
MKILKYVLILVVVGIGMFFVLNKNINKEPVAKEIENKTDVSTLNIANNTYYIINTPFTLKDGKAEIVTPGSSFKNTLEIFDSKTGDLDGDGDVDVAVLLVNSPGGLGKLFYAGLVMNNNGVAEPTGTMFLGDRISPQTIEIKDGRAVYNFVTRKFNEPATAEPSVGKSVWAHYDKVNNEIGEWVKDFEGEADTSRMTLDMKTWQWVSSTYNDGRKIIPKDASKFTLTFNKDGSFSSSTDCNGIGGNYLTYGENNITFGEMMGTLMFCEGAQENDFKDILNSANSFFFTSKGELIIELKFDSGMATFR